MTKQSLACRVEKFTRTNLTALLKSAPAGRKISEQASPLTLKVTTAGGQWIVVKKLAGKVVTFTPKTPDGTVIRNAANVWTPEQARDWARGVVGDLAKGLDPVPAKRPVVPTFVELGAEHLAHYVRSAAANSIKARRRGLRDAAAVLPAGPVTEVDISAAARLQSAYPQSPAKASQAWIAAKEVMRLAVVQGLVASNPFGALKAPKRPAGRTRYPRLEQLAAIERACREEGSVGAEIIRFVMRLPLRLGAATTLTWAEVDLESRELRLAPSEGRKFKAGQRLPLPDLAAELLAARRPPAPAPGDLAFPTINGTPPANWSRLYARLHRLSGVAGWSAHDFRRAMVSITAELRPDISEVHLDRLLTHSASSTNGGIKGVYQRASGFEGMRLACNGWDSLLRAALGSDRVQPRGTG